MRADFKSYLGAVLVAAASLFGQTRPAESPAKAPHSLQELSLSLEALASRVRPAVVQIFSTGYAAPEESENTNTGNLLSKQLSTGSGVIVSPDGYIVTNNHVVQKALKIEVKLSARGRGQETTVLAKLIGIDREADLAVIKIERTGLPQLELANSNELHQGQLVMAFGNPLGLEGSVSMGVVSSTGRQLKTDDPMVYVQTDAPINPGNSGGPLVDAEGRVVGINTFILTQSGGSEGIGFAVPSNVVRNSYDQIRKDGHVHRGQIGLAAQTITPLLARALHLSQDWGALVSDVLPGGPAEKEGLKPGDIILTVNGRVVEDARELDNIIYRQSLSDLIEIAASRDGKKLQFTIPVIESHDDPQRFADMVSPDRNLIRRLGILAIELNAKLVELLPDLRRDYGIVVAARAADAPGSSLEPGDVIYSIDGTPAVSIVALRATLDQLKAGDAIVLHIQRGVKLRYVAIELE